MERKIAKDKAKLELKADPEAYKKYRDRENAYAREWNSKRSATRPKTLRAIPLTEE